MINETHIFPKEDPFNLNRFIVAQEKIYDNVFAELKSGRKRTHWMWFIFPQIEGLGNSYNSKFYAIKSIGEAHQYLAHPVLGVRLIECGEAILAIEGKSALEIFGSPDDQKLKSSMTLFECAADSNSVFTRVLEKYFNNERDERTLRLLETGKS